MPMRGAGRSPPAAVQPRAGPTADTSSSSKALAATSWWPGEARRLFPLGSGLFGSFIVPDYDLTPDDKRFITVRLAIVNQAPGAGQLVVVDNWDEELKAKTRAARQ